MLASMLSGQAGYTAYERSTTTMPKPPITRTAPLSEHLEAYKNDTLKGLARHLGTYPPTRKTELVAWIHQRMLDPTGVRQLWDKLDRLQQQAVAEDEKAFRRGLRELGYAWGPAR